jgi:hypothetical protein
LYTPETAWTGSTNWTATGLCTQQNNGLLINDTQPAQVYRDQWHRLRAAAGSFPHLVSANSTAHTMAQPSPDRAAVSVWFSRTRKGRLGGACRGGGRRQAGHLISDVHAGRHRSPRRCHGACRRSESVCARGGLGAVGWSWRESADDVRLVGGASQQQARPDIIQPEGIAHPFANFAATVRYRHRRGRPLPSYMCQRDAIEHGQRICAAIPGVELDERIDELLIGAPTPMAIEVALAVANELHHAADADRIRAAHAERARHVDAWPPEYWLTGPEVPEETLLISRQESRHDRQID